MGATAHAGGPHANHPPQPLAVGGSGCAAGQPVALRSLEDGLKAQGMALGVQCHPQTGARAVQVIVVESSDTELAVR